MEAAEFPYEYGSDLHWFWGWGHRLDSLLADPTYNVSRYDAFVFQPDWLARNAMMRFSVKYPVVISEVQSYLRFAEDRFDAYLRDEESAEAEFSSAAFELMKAIQAAVKIVADAEQSPVMIRITRQPAAETTERTKVPWQDAAERLKQIKSAGQTWESYEKYALRFGCSRSTVKTAVDQTPELAAWASAGQAARPRKRKATQLSKAHIDSMAARRDEDPADSSLDDNAAQKALEKLLEEHPEQRDEILNKPAVERMRIARVYASQLADAESDSRSNVRERSTKRKH